MDNLSPEENRAMFDDDLHGNDRQAPESSGKDRSRLSKVQGWWTYARSIQSEARSECMRDHDVYDGDSWKPDDKAEVEARGQIAINFNRVAPTINWIIGTEKRNRIDSRVLPRGEEDVKPAETKQNLMKYVSDVNKLPDERSQAFRDCVISGLGWLEAGVGADPAEEPIFVEYEDWRNIWLDPLSVRIDIKDARFLFRRKRVDLDVACAIFPEYANALKIASRSNRGWDEYSDEYYDEETDLEAQIEAQGTETDETGGHAQRSRVELIECWYKVPEKIEVFRDGTEDVGTLRGTRYDVGNPDHQALIDGGFATTTSAIRMTVRCMIYCGNTILQDEVSPYNHNRFPFVPIWGYRKKKDNTQYGIVRNLRDIQDDLNKRRSKALFILATNQVIADKGAVDDVDELLDEVSRPDGYIEKNPGKELEINNERSLAKEHVEMMSQDAEYIESVGGVTDEQMGRETNAISGKAINARKEQGNVVNFELFDNLRVSTQMLGEILLSLIEQYYTDEKVYRITNEKNQPEFIAVNTPDPETGELLNDITASQADFIVDESAWSASLRQAAFETLMEMVTRMAPEISIQLLDLIVDLSDIPGKDDLVARIRMINGMEDPDADPNDPDALAEQEAKRSQEEAEAMFNETLRQLELAEKQSTIEKNQADARATNAGMAYDQEKLRIEKAKTLHAIQTDKESKEGKPSENKSTPATKTKDRVPETKKGEYGVRSDNQEKGVRA